MMKRSAPAATRISTNCSATVFAVGVLRVVLRDVRRTRLLAAPVDVHSPARLLTPSYNV